jgi:cytochrome c oxidase subunit 4
MSSISDPTPLHASDQPVAAEHGTGSGEHEEHGLAHISPWQTLVKVWVVLMILTILTVMATWIDLGAINIFIALGIAVIKATLVVMYFMHMKYDRPFNCFIFLFAFAFVAVFLGMAMLDTKHYAPMIEKRRLDEKAGKVELPPAPPAETAPAGSPSEAKAPEAAPAKAATPGKTPEKH